MNGSPGLVDGLTGDVFVFEGEMTEEAFSNSIMINTELPIVEGNFGTSVTNIIHMAVQ